MKSNTILGEIIAISGVLFLLLAAGIARAIDMASATAVIFGAIAFASAIAIGLYTTPRVVCKLLKEGATADGSLISRVPNLLCVDFYTKISNWCGAGRGVLSSRRFVALWMFASAIGVLSGVLGSLVGFGLFGETWPVGMIAGLTGFIGILLTRSLGWCDGRSEDDRTDEDDGQCDYSPVMCEITMENGEAPRFEEEGEVLEDDLIFESEPISEDEIARIN